MPHMSETMKQLVVHLSLSDFGVSRKASFLYHYSIKITPIYYRTLLKCFCLDIGTNVCC
uniref:Uncharacterized protein n=1 Tax=Arundo donax TaxID=35708 RepID=A0A0A9C2I4_ARUDO